MAQPVKDPALSLQWLGSLLWLKFEPWPRNFHMPQATQKKKKNTVNKRLEDGCLLLNKYNPQNKIIFFAQDHHESTHILNSNILYFMKKSF